MEGRRRSDMSYEHLSKKATQSTSQKNINNAPNTQSYNMSKHSRTKNHSTCSIFEECKTNDFKKTYLSKRKKRSRPKTQRPIVLINKFHMSLANYIQEHKSEIKLCGTKRFCEKTGEYYLNNVQLKQNPNFEDSAILPTLSLKEPTNLVNCIMRSNGLSNLSSKASDIMTKLPDNSLTPIPTMNLSKLEMRHKYEGKKLSNAERTAVHIRRLEYSTIFQRKERKVCPNKLLSIILIQQWWKVMYSIIRIQKFYRGRYFRGRLLDTLNIEEAQLERIFYVEKVFDRVLMRRALYQMFDSVGLSHTLPTMRNGLQFNKISVKKSVLRKMLLKWKAKAGLNNGSGSGSGNDNDLNDSNSYFDNGNLYNCDFNDNYHNHRVIRKLIGYKANIHLLPLITKPIRHLSKALMGDFFNKLKFVVPYLNVTSGSKTIKTTIKRKRHPSMKKFFENEGNNRINDNDANDDNDNNCHQFIDEDNDCEKATKRNRDNKTKRKPITPTSILDMYFGKWIAYLNNKAEVNRIVSSLIYMISSQSNSKAILTQRIHFDSNANVDIHKRTNKNKKTYDNEYPALVYPSNKRNTNSKLLNREGDISKPPSQYVYYKKNSSIASHIDDSNDKNSSSIQSNSQLDKHANRIHSDDGLIHYNRSPKVQKTNSNQLQSIGDDCTEVKALLTRSTIERDIKETQTEPVSTRNKCIGTQGDDNKEDALGQLIKKRVLKEYYLRLCALDPQILVTRASNLVLKKYHRKYGNTNEMFIKLGMKKWYYDHWKYLHERKQILKSIASNSVVIKKQSIILKKALKLKELIQRKGSHINLFNSGSNPNSDINANDDDNDDNESKSNVLNKLNNTSSNNNNNCNLQLAFKQWKNYTQNAIQYELLSFELIRVLSIHSKRQFIEKLKETPYVSNAKKNKINSITNHKLMRQQIENQIQNRKSNFNNNNITKRNNFKCFLYNTHKLHHTTTDYEETKSKYGLHTLSHSHSPFQKTYEEQSSNCITRNKSQNEFFEKGEAYNSAKLIVSKIDKRSLNKDDGKDEAYYLIPENKATLAPTIYSSQSFFLKKDYQEPDPQATKLHSDFLSLFDHNEPVVDINNTQRIQITKATVLAEDEGGDGLNDNTNDNNINDIIKKKVIERCSRDIDKRECVKREHKQKSKSKAKSPEQFYALPFNDNLREQLNVANDEDLQRFDLINHGKIYNMHSFISSNTNSNTNNNTQIKPSSPMSSDIQIGPELITDKSSTKKKRTNSCSIPDKEKVFQLTEMNSTQFYHTPIKESQPGTRNDNPLGTIGMYTNVSKSHRRGKKPSFRKRSTDNSILSSSLLSTIQQENPNSSAKNVVVSSQIQNSVNNSMRLYDNDNHRYVTQALSASYNPNYNNNDSQFQCQYQSNQLNKPGAGQLIYQEPLPLYSNKKLKDDRIMMSNNKTNKQCMCSKGISSKQIQFQSQSQSHSRNQEDQVQYVRGNNTITNSIIYKSGDSYDYHFEKDFFNHSYPKLLIHRLFSEATVFRKKDNLHYLIKITFHFKHLYHLGVIKSMIIDWHKLSKSSRSKSTGSY